MWPATQTTSKSHGIMIDPYKRVGVFRSQVQLAWSASITRAVLMEPPKQCLATALTALVEINKQYVSIKELWDITLDERPFFLHVIELLPGFEMCVPRRISFKFIPLDQLANEMLDNTRHYSHDSVLVFSHITSYITDTGIGKYKFRGEV